MVILSYFFLMFGNGILSLTNPDEVFYAQTAREMIKHNSWMTPYLFGQPQFEKPILTYWLLRLAFRIFGISSFSARFFPALFAMIGVVAVYFLGLLGFKEGKKAFLSGLILMSAALYIGLARTLFTDMIFSIFILLSLLSFFWGYCAQQKKRAGLLLFFIFCALAVLTKGPLGFLIPVLTIGIFLLIKAEIKFLFCRASVLGFVIFVAISLPWYMLMVNKFGHSFTYEFFYNDHIRRILQAEHTGNDRWYFYPMSIIGCTFPWSLFVGGSLLRLPKYLRRKENPFLIFLASWIVVVFIVFQFAHSKLTSYIFPLFPALALISAQFINEKIKAKKVIYSLVFITPLILIVSLLIKNNIEPYVSSKLTSEYLLKNYDVKNTIICSKPFVRGVRYYTQKEVAHTSIPGLPFFSPHPIPFLNTDKLVREFLRRQSVTYCVLKKSSVEDMQRLTEGKDFKCTLLNVIGNEYLMKIEHVIASD